MAERSCVVCRAKTSPEDLVRLALGPDGTVVIDFRGKLPGRGGWVHPACLSTLQSKPGMLRRALKTPVQAGPWMEQYTSALERAIRDGLSMASAAGALAGGQVVLSQALRDGEVLEVAVASDCAERTEKALRDAAPEGTPFTRLPLTASDVGHVVGRGPRAAVGVRRSRAATHLQRQLHRLRSLG